MFLPVYILYSLLLLTSCSEFHDKVFSNLLRLCPGQYVPIDNGTVLNQTSEIDSCCTDNFSNSFPTHSVLNKTNYATNGQSCLLPRRTDVVKEKYQHIRSYFMVTDPPKDGCLLRDKDTKTIRVKNINHPTCHDSDVSPFRRFLPVYSRSSGFIYKNPQCASCHGQYDVNLWTTFVDCQTSTALSYELEDCDFQFVYPGDHDDIQHLECFTDYYSACPEVTTADDDMFGAVTDLSTSELTDACSMDNFPRFADLLFAKNVFCFICHYCKNRCSNFVKSCSPPVTDTRSPVNGFTRILDSRVVSQLNTDHDTVCETEQNERVCHELLCPLGQVLIFDGLERKCQMDSTQWTTQQFSTLLLLEFENSIDVHENNLEMIFTQTQSPWPESWYIEILYQPFARNVDMLRVGASKYNVTQAFPVNSIRHAYVQLTYRHTTVKPDVLLREFENLVKSSLLPIDEKRHRVRQTLGKSKFWNVEVKLTPGDLWRQVGIPSWQISPDIEPYNRWLYTSLDMRTKRKHAYVLNKLMICKQVELTSANFHMITHMIGYSEFLLMLYYNRTGQYIYDNEFTKGSGVNGEQSFRLCVSDARIGSNESVRLRINLKLILLAMVVFNVL